MHVDAFNPTHHASPAALANSFLFGANITRLPDDKAWHQAWVRNPMMNLILDLVANNL